MFTMCYEIYMLPSRCKFLKTLSWCLALVGFPGLSFLPWNMLFSSAPFSSSLLLLPVNISPTWLQHLNWSLQPPVHVLESPFLFLSSDFFKTKSKHVTAWSKFLTVPVAFRTARTPIILTNSTLQNIPLLHHLPLLPSPLPEGIRKN